jgi:PBP1b-binding outer membrane lipoprotein LpoB
MKKALIAALAISVILIGCTSAPTTPTNNTDAPGMPDDEQNTTTTVNTASGNLTSTNASYGVTYELTHQDGRTTYDVSTTTPTPGWTYTAQAETNNDVLRIDLTASSTNSGITQVLSQARANGSVTGDQPTTLVITTANNPLTASQYNGSITWDAETGAVTQSS